LVCGLKELDLLQRLYSEISGWPKSEELLWFCPATRFSAPAQKARFHQENRSPLFVSLCLVHSLAFVFHTILGTGVCCRIRTPHLSTWTVKCNFGYFRSIVNSRRKRETKFAGMPLVDQWLMTGMLSPFTLSWVLKWCIFPALSRPFRRARDSTHTNQCTMSESDRYERAESRSPFSLWYKHYVEST
jgi:hypothetical protein